MMVGWINFTGHERVLDPFERCVHPCTHIHTHSWGDIGLQESPSRPKDHSTSGHPTREVSLGTGTRGRVPVPPPPAQTPSAPNL